MKIKPTRKVKYLHSREWKQIFRTIQDLLFTEEEEEALNREPTAEERLTAEWMFSRITSMKCNVERKDG